MATDVVIPKLGMTMKEGTIVEWAVADGARIERDQVVFVLSTDKLDTDVTAEASGTLQHRAAIRETHPVGTVVAVILADGEVGGDRSRGRSVRTCRLVAIRAPPRARARRRARAPAGHWTGRPRHRGGRDPRTRSRPCGVGNCCDPGRAPARRPARRRPFTCGRHRSSRSDHQVRRHEARLHCRPRVPADSIPLRGMRKVIAERMHASLQEMAQLTLGMEVDMTDAVTLRKQLVREWERDGVNVSFTDLVGRAVVKALGEHPALKRERRWRGHPISSDRAPRSCCRGRRRPARARRAGRRRANAESACGGDIPPGFGVPGRHDRVR